MSHPCFLLMHPNKLNLSPKTVTGAHSGVGGGMLHGSTVPLLADQKKSRILGACCQLSVQALSVVVNFTNDQAVRILV